MGGKKDVAARGARAPDRQQIEALFRQHYGRVKHFFLHKGCSEDLALDLLQSTFLRAAGSAGPTQHGSETGWLFVIASNVWRSHLRDGAAAKRDGDEVPIEGQRDGGEALLSRGVAGPQRDPLDDLLRRERKAALARAIDDLPVQRKTFLQLFIKGHKYRDIAAMFGVNVNTVKSQIFKARAALRGKLGEIFDGEPPDPRSVGS
ncbi:MAG: RNA polymerase sigma factor [Acidobacteriota bacterium]